MAPPRRRLATIAGWTTLTAAAWVYTHLLLGHSLPPLPTWIICSTPSPSTSPSKTPHPTRSPTMTDLAQRLVQAPHPTLEKALALLIVAAPLAIVGLIETGHLDANRYAAWIAALLGAWVNGWAAGHLHSLHHARTYLQRLAQRARDTE